MREFEVETPHRAMISSIYLAGVYATAPTISRLNADLAPETIFLAGPDFGHIVGSC